MKKRLILMAVIIAAVACVVSLLSFNTLAQEQQITVSFMDGINSTTLDKTVGTNGVLTVETGKKIILPVKTVDVGYCLVWATPDGRAWSAGETVSFTEDTVLYQFKAMEVDTINAMKTAVASGTAVKLMDDLVSESGSISTKNQGITNFFMNGHTLTVKGTNRGFEEERAGRRFYGEGKIVFEPNDDSGTGAHLFRMHSHGYAGYNNYLLVGADIIIEAPNAILGQDTNSGEAGYPKMDIYGKVTAYRLLHLNSGGERYPSVNVYEGAEVILTGPSLTDTTKYSGTVNVNISGGTLMLNADGATVFSSNANANNQDAEYNIFNITGGSFALIDGEADALEDLLSEEYTLVSQNVGSYTYFSVVPSDCAHTYEKTEQESSCIISYRTDFNCSLCLDSFYVESGEKKPHDFVQISDVPATPTEMGVKTFECSVCKTTIISGYSYDPSLVSVNVTVVTQEGEKNVSASVTDVFELGITGSNGAYNYTIVGIKDFDDYYASSVIEIDVPACISAIRFENDASGLKTLNIDDGAKISVYSFKTLSALETINIGAATVTFKEGCSNSVIKNIFSNKEGAYVIYDRKAFSKITSLEKVTFSTNSDYVLEEEAFGNCTGIKEIIFPDYSRPQFLGRGFWENHAEYIYVGRGITSLDNNPFDRSYKLQKAVLMEVNKFTSEYTFCWSYDWATDNDPTTGPAEIYIHSSELTIANLAFFESHGITVYTNAPITNSSAFKGCESKFVDGVYYQAYTIYYGIPHKYAEIYEAPTCTETGLKGYKSDCPCGETTIEGVVTAQKFTRQLTNSNDYEYVNYTCEIIPVSEHVQGEITNIVYRNGYLKLGDVYALCNECQQEFVDTSVAQALFTYLGYSMPEDGAYSLTLGFLVNTKGVELYEFVTGRTIEYGTVGAVASSLDGKAPLDSSLDGVRIVKIPMPKGYQSFDFIISGFNAELFDLEIVMAAYVIDDGKTVYLQRTQTELPDSISINKYLQECEKNVLY